VSDVVPNLGFSVINFGFIAQNDDHVYEYNLKKNNLKSKPFGFEMFYRWIKNPFFYLLNTMYSPHKSTCA
jgi:hypothetical protein